MQNLPFETNLANADLIPDQKGPPHALFAAWRNKEPVHWNPPSKEYSSQMEGSNLDQGFWVLTRYQDVFSVSRDQSKFSSHEGGPIIWDLESEQLEMQRAGLMGMEHHQHTAMKQLILPPFAPRELARFEPEIESVAHEIVDSIASKGACEFVFDVASKLPVYTFCKLMGIPDDLRDTVYKLGNAAADVENRRKLDYDPGLELFGIAQKLSEGKRIDPDTSILSRVVHGAIDGKKLDDLNINMLFVTIAIAGHETTRSTAAHFMRLMNEYPEQYELLKSDVDKYLPNAIDEVLRFSPPVINFRRTVLEETEIGGQAVSKGDKVYLSYAAANRDPAKFEDPDKFDITRENASAHLSFGTGPHICIGARLAHIQLRALLKQVITRFPDIHVVGDMVMMKSIWFNAILEMNLEFTPEV